MILRVIPALMLINALLFAEEPRIDPAAKELLTEFAQATAQRPARSFKFGLKVLASQGDDVMDEAAHFDVAIEQPNKLRLEVTQGRGVTLVSDGHSSISYIPFLKQYRKTPAPETMAHLIMGDPILSTFSAGATSFLWMMVDIQNADTFLADVSWMVDMGSEEIAGETYRRVFMQKRNVDMNIWIDPVRLTVRRVVPDLAKLVQTQAGAEVSMTLDFVDWSEQVTADAFIYEVPSNARLVKQFGPNSQPPEKGLVGEAAPPFSLQNLAGETVTLQQHKDKQVVVLDFWATWCGPCRMTMPLIAELAAEYRDRDVAVYALNLKEPKPKIEDFLKKLNLDLDVVMDLKGTVGSAYSANSIPQTVIIGRDGRVKAIHIGFDPNLKAKLKKDIDTLLESHQLVD